MAEDMAMKVANDAAAKWIAAWNADDPRGLAAMFTPDGVFLSASARELKMA
jgi:uncharacterized protein (TIGR02246 family)